MDRIGQKIGKVFQNLTSKSKIKKDSKVTKDVLLNICKNGNFDGNKVNHKNIVQMQNLLLKNGYDGNMSDAVDALEMLTSS